MNKRRLLKLADLLEADAKNKKGVTFDLSTVARPTDWVLFDDDAKIEVSCGTTACAMGLAAISGAFKRAGLSYKIKNGEMWPTINGRSTGFDTAACRIFDIPMEAADFFFLPYSYRESERQGAKGERAVAKRIRDFVAGKVSPSNL